jgi:ABC-type phosphate transport system substrate-binding protein
MRATTILLLIVAILGLATSAAGATTTGAGSDMPNAAYQVLCRQSALCTYSTGLPTSSTQWAGVDGVGGAAIAARLGGRATFIPTAVGSIAVVVNLPGKNGAFIKLRGSVLGQIMAGRIERWDAKPIRLTNVSARMPQTRITLCATKGASGINLIATHYLSRVSSVFRAAVGTSAQPQWKAARVVLVGSFADIGACLSKHVGGVAFLPFGDALQQGISGNAIQLGWSKPGTAYFPGGVTKPTTVDEFVGPNDVSAQKAAGSIGSSASLPDIAASKRPGSYPLTVLVGVAARLPLSAANATTFRSFLSTTAQNALQPLGYAALPSGIRNAALKRIAAAS